MLQDQIFSYPSTFIIPCSILVLVKTGIRYWNPCKKYQKQLSAYGGYHSTLIYDEVCKGNEADPFDFFVRGEGDLCFNELLEAINGKRPLEGIPGVSFRNDGRFIHNSQRPLEDLAKIKIPDRSRRIWKGYQYYGFTLDIVESSRGCVMPCNFCSIDKMYGKSFRRFSIERILADIDNAKHQGANFIIFSDDN